MASFDTTSHDVFLMELWARAMLAFTNALVMRNRVMDFSNLIAERGQIVNIPTVQNITAAAVGSGGTYAGVANTETQFTITVNRWVEASVKIPDNVAHFASEDLAPLYAKKLAYSIAEDVETRLLNLYSGLANQVGAASVPVTDDVLLNAIQIIDEGRAPLEDRTLVFRPASKRTLMKIDKFVDASKTGLGKGAQVTGLFGEIYGIPIFFSNNVVSSSGIHNMVFHKEAFGIAVAKEVKMEKFRLQLANDYVAHVLFGTAELRDASAVGTAACDILT